MDDAFIPSPFFESLICFLCQGLRSKDNKNGTFVSQIWFKHCHTYINLSLWVCLGTLISNSFFGIWRRRQEKDKGPSFSLSKSRDTCRDEQSRRNLWLRLKNCGRNSTMSDTHVSSIESNTTWTLNVNNFSNKIQIWVHYVTETFFC